MDEKSYVIENLGARNVTETLPLSGLAGYSPAPSSSDEADSSSDEDDFSPNHGGEQPQPMEVDEDAVITLLTRYSLWWWGMDDDDDFPGRPIFRPTCFRSPVFVQSISSNPNLT